MADLSNTEHELVALGAAIASNCIPCAEFHIAEARKLGLTDTQIVEAVRLADKVWQVPARNFGQSRKLIVPTSTPEDMGHACAGFHRQS